MGPQSTAVFDSSDFGSLFLFLVKLCSPLHPTVPSPMQRLALLCSCPTRARPCLPRAPAWLCGSAWSEALACGLTPLCAVGSPTVGALCLLGACPGDVIFQVECLRCLPHENKSYAGTSPHCLPDDHLQPSAFPRWLSENAREVPRWCVPPWDAP